MRKENKNPKKPPAPARPAHIGQRLRKLRSARRLTLEQLSRMAGVSPAMLSQIEQQKVNPTVAVMLKIADALQLAVAELIDAPAQRNIFRVISAADKHYTFRSDPLCTIRTLSPLSLEKSIEFYRLTLAPRGELASEPHFPGTEEFLHVARGRLAVASGGQTMELGKGDSIHYRGDVPHALRNVGKGQTEVYLIVRYRGD